MDQQLSSYFNLPKHQYGAIHIDIPWGFKTYSKDGAVPQRAKNQHYPTMTRAEINAMPIPELAAKDCAMFMWIVDAQLEQALEHLKQWDFKYKTRVFTWVKTTKSGHPAMGMGYWSRRSTEVCLLATRGKPRRISKSVGEVIMAPRREHSRKPEEVYSKIEKLVNGPYLDIFGRKDRPGWEVWGNEANKFDDPVDHRTCFVPDQP